MNQIATAATWFSIFFEKAFVKRVKRLMPVSAPSRLLDRRSVRLLKSERSTPHQEMKRIRVNADEKVIRFSRSRPEPEIQREPRSTGTR
jgi:hypothetical protein